MWPQRHFGAYMSNALTCGPSWDNSWHSPKRFTRQSDFFLCWIWMIHLYFRPHTWKSSTQIAIKKIEPVNYEHSDLLRYELEEAHALKGPEKPTIWKCQLAPEPQRLHGKWWTWPSRPGTQEDLEISNVEQVEHWNSRSLHTVYNSNIVANLTLRMLWASGGLVSSGLMIHLYQITKSPHVFILVSLSTASALCTSSIPIFGSHLWSWSVDFRAETFSKSTAKTKSALVKKNKASKITYFWGLCHKSWFYSFISWGTFFASHSCSAPSSEAQNSPRFHIPESPVRPRQP